MNITSWFNRRRDEWKRDNLPRTENYIDEDGREMVRLASKQPPAVARELRKGVDY